MPFDYPVIIHAADFIDPVHPIAPPRPRIAPVGRSEVRNKINQYDLVKPSYTAVSIKLKSRAGAGQSHSFLSTVHPDIPSAGNRFCFAPNFETVDIEWAIRGLPQVNEALIQVFPRNSTDPIFTRRLSRSRRELVPDDDRAPGETSVGTVAWNGSVNTPAGTTAFPKGFVTVARSPYKVKLTLIGLHTAVTTKHEVFTYFDVKLHDLEMEWGDWNWVDQSRGARPDITDEFVNKILDVPDPAAPHAPPVPGLERYAFSELRRVSPNPSTNGAEHEVLLTSNSFIKRAPGGDMAAHSEDQKDFNQYKNMWGAGPRIPLSVKAWIATSNGGRTDLAVEALDGSKILWDWQDNDPVRWRQALTPGGTTDRTRDFLQTAYTSHAPGLNPPNSNNCLAQFGGKYGDPAATVFPAPAGGGPFPFTVLAPGAPGALVTRNWAAVSEFGAGPNANKSGVIFQPSRMAGDRYAVQAYLYFDPGMDAVADIVTPPSVRASAGIFRIFRRVDVCHIIRGSDAARGISAATCRTYTVAQYRKEMHIDLKFSARPVTQAEYSDTIDRMIAVLEAKPETFKEVPYPALTLPLLIDRVGADNSAMAFVDWPAFQTAVRNAFLNGMVYRVRLTGGPFTAQDQLRGAAARGYILGNYLNPTPAEPHVLVPVRAQQYVNGEAVTTRANGQNGTITVLERLSCWGVIFDDYRLAAVPWVLTADENQEAVNLGITTHHAAVTAPYTTAIDVTIGGQPHVRINYPRHGFSRTLDTALPATARQALQTALNTEMAAPGLNLNNPLHIVIRGKWDSDNSKTRWKVLRDFLLSIIPDRKAVADRVIGAIDLFHDRATFLRRIRRELPTQLLIPAWLEVFQRTYVPGRDGVFLINTAGRTNVRLLPDAGNGFLDLSVTGASFNDAFPGEWQRGATYVASLPAGAGVDPAPTKAAPSIFSHELAHALFIPHAFSRSNPAVMVPTPSAIAHVAEDTCVMNYDHASNHFCGLCMLRMRGWNWDAAVDLEYQLVLRLGDPDDLFSTADLFQEVSERLQVMGLHNRPIGYHDQVACAMFSLGHAENLFPALAGLTTAQLRAAMAPLILDYLVEGGALPAPGQFRKIRVPGGFPTIYGSAALEARFDPSQQGTAVAQPFEQYMLEGSNRFAIEDSYFQANPALGKIPISAHVKMRPKGSGMPWAAAPAAAGVKVCFKLLDPDPLPAYVPGAVQHAVCGGTSFHNQVTPVPLAQRPSHYLLPRIGGYQPDRTGSPERVNAHVDVGGRRGSPNPPFKTTRATNFQQIPASSIVIRKGEVEVVAGDDGLARVMFDPSRIGGDRYKIEAYVGNNAQGNAVPVRYADTTGTMVRWRTQRVCANVHQPSSATAANLPPEYSPGGNLYDAALRQHVGVLEDIDLERVATEAAKAYVEVIVEPAAMNPVPISNFSADFYNTVDSLLVSFPRFNRSSQARMLVAGGKYSVGITKQALVANPARTQYTATLESHTPEHGTLTIRPPGAGPDAWIAKDTDGSGNLAVRNPVSAATVNYVNGQVVVDFNVAQAVGAAFEAYYYPDQYFDFRNLVFFPAASPYLINLRLPADYNGRKAAGKVAMSPVGPNPKPSGVAYLRAEQLGPITSLIMQALVHCVNNNNGYYPGVVIFSARDVDNYSGIWDVGGERGGKSFGNGVFVFRRANFTTAYFRSLVLHEMSHSYYFHHAPGGGTSGAKPDLHDGGDICVMSYDQSPQNDGDMCGKCIASLRGMNIREGPFRD